MTTPSEKIKEVFELLRMGETVKSTAKISGVSVPVVQKVRNSNSDFFKMGSGNRPKNGANKERISFRVDAHIFRKFEKAMEYHELTNTEFFTKVLFEFFNLGEVREVSQKDCDCSELLESDFMTICPRCGFALPF